MGRGTWLRNEPSHQPGRGWPPSSTGMPLGFCSLLPAGWKPPAAQEGLHNPRGTRFLFPSGIFLSGRGRALAGRVQPLSESCECGRRSPVPAALPSLCLAWRAILSPTCGCLCDFPGGAASLTSEQNNRRLETLGARRHRPPPQSPASSHKMIPAAGPQIPFKDPGVCPQEIRGTDWIKESLLGAEICQYTMVPHTAHLADVQLNLSLGFQ